MITILDIKWGFVLMELDCVWQGERVKGEKVMTNTVVVRLGQAPTVTEVTQMAFQKDAFWEQEGDFIYHVRLGGSPARWYYSEELEEALAKHLARYCAQ